MIFLDLCYQRLLLSTLSDISVDSISAAVVLLLLLLLLLFLLLLLQVFSSLCCFFGVFLHDRLRQVQVLCSSFKELAAVTF